MKIKINKVPFFNTSTDLLLQVGRLQQSITQLTFVTCQTVLFFGLCVLAFFFSFSFFFFVFPACCPHLSALLGQSSDVRRLSRAGKTIPSVAAAAAWSFLFLFFPFCSAAVSFPLCNSLLPATETLRRLPSSDVTSTQKSGFGFVIGSHGRWRHPVIHRAIVRWSASSCLCRPSDPELSYMRIWSGYSNSEDQPWKRLSTVLKWLFHFFFFNKYATDAGYGWSDVA